MRDKAIKWVIIFGLLAIVGILLFQVYWVVNNWQDNQEEKEQRINIALRKTAEGLHAYSKTDHPDEELITRRSSNYYIVNINDVIDANILEFFLINELNKVGLSLDFEYAIYDCDRDQMVYGNYCNISDSPAKPSAELPKYDKFEYYFGVRFPQLRSSILGDMPMTIILSAILILTLTFFTLTIYIILHQQRFSALQKEFINNMTHEFKTPLSSIRIGADTFLSSPELRGNARLNKYARIIKDQADRLNMHVEKILDVARLEKDQFKLKFEKIDLYHLIEQTHERFVPIVEEQGGVLDLIMPEPSEWLMVKADLMHSTNIIHNLLDNALKYGGKPPELLIHVIDNKNAIEIHIKDNGNGLSKTEISQIFNKFYRSAKGNIHDIKGFGLGLYYVKQIVKLQNWTVRVESEQGIGSNFILSIPKV
jgi:two-component system phosphate regulon sensor histidine kinase PhoR